MSMHVEIMKVHLYINIFSTIKHSLWQNDYTKYNMRNFRVGGTHNFNHSI